MITVESPTRILMVGSASVVEEDREFAWAQPHIVRQPDVRWILGNFVQAEKPNSNGHIVETADLRDAMKTIPHKALNVNHVAGRRVGCFTAAEMVYPLGGEEEPPIVEALAAFWHYYEPELWPTIEVAHRSGQLFFSMETVPQTITCRGKGSFEGCGATFEYAGRQSSTYCAHLNETCSRKVLHKPQYTAGALIIPPVRPGWKEASVKEVSAFVEARAEEADALYKEVALEVPQGDPASWERIVTFLLTAGAHNQR